MVNKCYLSIFWQILEGKCKDAQGEGQIWWFAKEFFQESWPLPIKKKKKKFITVFPVFKNSYQFNIGAEDQIKNVKTCVCNYLLQILQFSYRLSFLEMQ